MHLVGLLGKGALVRRGPYSKEIGRTESPTTLIYGI